MTARKDPYRQFNFRVTITPRSGPPISAAFTEISGLGHDDPRGDASQSRKITGMHKAGDVTLKRGVIAAETLAQWLSAKECGGDRAKASIVIALMSEDRRTVVATWRIDSGMPKKLVAPTRNAKSNGDVAIEALELTHEGISTN